MSKTRKAADAEHKATRKVARKRNTMIVGTLGKASEIADQPPLIAISLITMVAGMVLRQPVALRTGTRMLASHLIATSIKTVIKRSVDRTRPARALARGGHKVEKGKGAKDSGLNSFPSGHTAGAVAIAQAVTNDVPAAALPMRLAAGSIGAMQLPRGKHYASDVVVGAAIGWLSERIASAAMAAAGEVRTSRNKQEAREAEAAAHPS
jgi:membrane-associated phospholipid phosphatase